MHKCAYAQNTTGKSLWLRACGREPEHRPPKGVLLGSCSHLVLIVEPFLYGGLKGDKLGVVKGKGINHMSIQDIEAAVSKLPPDQLQAFFSWVDRFRSEKTPPSLSGDGGTIIEQETVPYERIAHLAGIIDAGPSDLASNKKYLDGLGESSMS